MTGLTVLTWIPTPWLKMDASAWLLPKSGDDAYFFNDRWRLEGFDPDEDVLVTGVEVHGLLYWGRTVGGQVQRRKQLFAAPNPVPNPGFEFQDLFVDARVDGYVGIYAHVSPFVNHALPDSYNTRPGRVAVIETRGKG
jgi:hypothetical protein